MKIETNTVTPRISEIYTQIKNGNLILRPTFQRNFVWTLKHQEEFIDTILQGFPFPEVYVCDGNIDLESFNTTTLVIDGQQRLTTIKRYIEGYEGEFKKVTPYKLLSAQEKEKFLGYKVVVRNIGKVEEETIKEIFRRINLTKFSLDAIEIQNAIYDGEFIQTAKEIISVIQINNYKVLKESELDRMADLHYVLLIMATIENQGYFSQDSELENIISRFNDIYPNKDKIKEVIYLTFEIINDLNLPIDSVWFRKSNFFTMVIEICNYLIGRSDNIDGAIKYNKPDINNLKKLLDDFSYNLYKYKLTKKPYSEYYSCMYQGTNNRKSRVIRANIFNSEIMNKI